MDALVTNTRNVLVTVRRNSDGSVSWIYNNDPASDGVVFKRTAGEIIYRLQDSTEFQFCAPPEVDNDPDNQLVNASYTPTTAQVTDLHTSATDVPMSIYLFVQDTAGTRYRSPDPEIINTDGT
jgi:hypothetical protein